MGDMDTGVSNVEDSAPTTDRQRHTWRHALWILGFAVISVPLGVYLRMEMGEVSWQIPPGHLFPRTRPPRFRKKL